MFISEQMLNYAEKQKKSKKLALTLKIDKNAF